MHVGEQTTHAPIKKHTSRPPPPQTQGALSSPVDSVLPAHAETLSTCGPAGAPCVHAPPHSAAGSYSNSRPARPRGPGPSAAGSYSNSRPARPRGPGPCAAAVAPRERNVVAISTWIYLREYFPMTQFSDHFGFKGPTRESNF